MTNSEGNIEIEKENDCHREFHWWKYVEVPKEIRGSRIGPSSWRGLKREPELTFSRFSRKICLFEKNFKIPKIFCIKFSTKMALMKILVAIILTKLQRSESRANDRSENRRSEANFGSPNGQNWRHVRRQRRIFSSNRAKFSTQTYSHIFQSGPRHSTFALPLLQFQTAVSSSKWSRQKFSWEPFL